MRVGFRAAALISFIKSLLFLRTAVLGVIIIPLIYFVELFISFVNLKIQIHVIVIYIFVFLLEGIADFIRTCIFEPLLHQGHAQANIALRNVAVLITVMLASFHSPAGLTILEVVFAELIGVLIAMVTVLFQLVVVLRRARSLDVVESSQCLSIPTAREMIAFGANNFASDILQIAGSSNTMMMVGARLLDPTSLAGFGFARILAERLRQYQPAQILIGLLRPKFFADYSIEKNPEILNERTALILKLSMFVLAPGITLFVVYGREILNAISNDNYGSAYNIMLVLLFWIVVRSHLLVVSIVINTLERPSILRRSSVGGVAALIFAVVVVSSGGGAIGLATALAVGDTLFLVLAVAQTKRAGFNIRFDFAGQSRIYLVAISSGVIVAPLAIATDGLTWLCAGIIAICAVYFGLARIFRPFRHSERELINRLLNKPIFIW